MFLNYLFIWRLCYVKDKEIFEQRPLFQSFIQNLKDLWTILTVSLKILFLDGNLLSKKSALYVAVKIILHVMILKNVSGGSSVKF